MPKTQTQPQTPTWELVAQASALVMAQTWPAGSTPYRTATRAAALMGVARWSEDRSGRAAALAEARALASEVIRGLTPLPRD